MTVRIQTRSLHTDYSGNALFGMMFQTSILYSNDSVWTSLTASWAELPPADRRIGRFLVAADRAGLGELLAGIMFLFAQ